MKVADVYFFYEQCCVHIYKFNVGEKVPLYAEKVSLYAYSRTVISNC